MHVCMYVQIYNCNLSSLSSDDIQQLKCETKTTTKNTELIAKAVCKAEKCVQLKKMRATIFKETAERWVRKLAHSLPICACVCV